MVVMAVAFRGLHDAFRPVWRNELSPRRHTNQSGIMVEYGASCLHDLPPRKQDELRRRDCQIHWQDDSHETPSVAVQTIRRNPNLYAERFSNRFVLFDKCLFACFHMHSSLPCVANFHTVFRRLRGKLSRRHSRRKHNSRDDEVRQRRIQRSRYRGLRRQPVRLCGHASLVPGKWCQSLWYHSAHLWLSRRPGATKQAWGMCSRRAHDLVVFKKLMR